MSKSAAVQARSVELERQQTTENVSPVAAPGYHEISEMARQLWIDRGCPEGSPEEDWFRAEELLNDGRSIKR